MIFNTPSLLQLPKDQSTEEVPLALSQLYHRVSIDDFVCVVWIDDLLGYRRLSKRLRQATHLLSKAMVFIFVNPLSGNAAGLFWVRIVIPPGGNYAVAAAQRLSDNTLVSVRCQKLCAVLLTHLLSQAFGPLVDGMIISQHALGALIRNTSLSAHQACRVVTESYTRPYVAEY